MDCPECSNNKLAVYDSRHFMDIVVRKRKCSACDYRFYTIESIMSIDQLEHIQSLRKEADVDEVLHDVPER